MKRVTRLAMQINRAIFSRGSLHGAGRFSKRTTAVGIISSIRGRGTGLAGPQAHPSMRSAYPVLSMSKGQDDPSIPQDERRLPLGWSLRLQTRLRRFGKASGGLQGARIYAKRTTAVGTILSSRGRGTGFAGPQAQRPPRGAGSYAKRTTVGAQS